MCKYCEEMELLAPKLLQGKNISETYGDIFIENVQNRNGNNYYISCDCHDKHHTESYNINFCPMCGRKLNEE
jgi:hypothetical protein